MSRSIQQIAMGAFLSVGCGLSLYFFGTELPDIMAILCIGGFAAGVIQFLDGIFNAGIDRS